MPPVANTNSLKCCLVIPTFNHAPSLATVVEQALPYVEQLLVVDDGSTDATAEVIQAFGQRIASLSYHPNRGKGYALQQAARWAQEKGFEAILTMDSDGQHFAEDIPLLLRAAECCPQAIIVGARNLIEENKPAQNVMANRWANFWFAFQTLQACPDTQSGFRYYPLSAFRNKHFLCRRYAFELEVLVRHAWRFKALLSVPIRVYYPPADQRVSHFHPVKDFLRITVLNTALSILALLYFYPQWLVFRLMNRYKSRPL